MKLLLILACCQLSAALMAQEIVVFSKGDSLALNAGTAGTEPKDAEKLSFLSAFKADLAHPSTFTKPAKLSDLPEFGRHVPGATGEIQYHEKFNGGFVVRTQLEGLTPSHRYILTLNGNPARAGNDKLMETVSHNQKEKYYDFQTVTTDAHGRYRATFGIVLPPGPYDVRFYVKDTADFKIILYHDFFKFAVSK